MRVQEWTLGPNICNQSVSNYNKEFILFIARFWNYYHLYVWY